MMELDGLMQPMEGLEDFHEATWVHKYNGKYYLSYSDNHDENWNDGVIRDKRSSQWDRADIRQRISRDGRRK